MRSERVPLLERSRCFWLEGGSVWIDVIFSSRRDSKLCEQRTFLECVSHDGVTNCGELPWRCLTGAQISPDSIGMKPRKDAAAYFVQSCIERLSASAVEALARTPCYLRCQAVSD